MLSFCAPGLERGARLEVWLKAHAELRKTICTCGRISSNKFLMSPCSQSCPHWSCSGSRPHRGVSEECGHRDRCGGIVVCVVLRLFVFAFVCARLCARARVRGGGLVCVRACVSASVSKRACLGRGLHVPCLHGWQQKKRQVGRCSDPK